MNNNINDAVTQNMMTKTLTFFVDIDDIDTADVEFLDNIAKNLFDTETLMYGIRGNELKKQIEIILREKELYVLKKRFSDPITSSGEIAKEINEFVEKIHVMEDICLMILKKELRTELIANKLSIGQLEKNSKKLAENTKSSLVKIDGISLLTRHWLRRYGIDMMELTQEDLKKIGYMCELAEQEIRTKRLELGYPLN